MATKDVTTASVTDVADVTDGMAIDTGVDDIAAVGQEHEPSALQGPGSMEWSPSSAAVATGVPPLDRPAGTITVAVVAPAPAAADGEPLPSVTSVTGNQPPEDTPGGPAATETPAAAVTAVEPHKEPPPTAAVTLAMEPLTAEPLPTPGTGGSGGGAEEDVELVDDDGTLTIPGRWWHPSCIVNPPRPSPKDYRGNGDNDDDNDDAPFVRGADVEAVSGPVALNGRCWVSWQAGCKWLGGVTTMMHAEDAAAAAATGTAEGGGMCQVKVMSANGEDFELKEVREGSDARNH